MRNALIANYNSLDLRLNKGALWENFLISERIKYLKYNEQYAKSYFWLTAQQQETDWIEEIDVQLTAYEFNRIQKRMSNSLNNLLMLTKLSLRSLIRIIIMILLGEHRMKLRSVSNHPSADGHLIGGNLTNCDHSKNHKIE